jgi:hypothetical protein
MTFMFRNNDSRAAEVKTFKVLLVSAGFETLFAWSEIHRQQ